MKTKNERKNITTHEGAEWLRRQGHTVVNLRNLFMYDHSPGVFQAFPYHAVIDLSSDEIRDFFHQTKALVLRYSSSWKSGLGKPSYHVIFNKKDYNLASLSKKPRRDVKIGLDYAVIEPIPISRLAMEGWGVRLDTLKRQGRTRAESKEMWETLCLSADGLKGFEAWGALRGDVLVASVLCYKIQDTVSILYQQSLTDHLKFGVNNTLTYVVTNEMMQRPDVKCIFYGLESLDAPSSVDEYKFRMGYRAKPVLQRIEINPLLTPFLVKINYLFIKLAYQKFSTPFLAKTEGSLRFYLQRNCALCEKPWPETCWIKENLSCPYESTALKKNSIHE